MLTSLIAIDLGCDGAMVVIRNVGNGPEVLCPPYTWRFRRRDRYDRHKGEIHDHLRLLLQEYRPRVVAMENPRSILGRRHVGVSQSWMAAEMALICEMARPSPRVIRVPGQGPKAAARAWAIMRSSFAEILSREEMREVSGEAGEHVRDACAVALAALARLPRASRRKTVGSRAN